MRQRLPGQSGNGGKARIQFRHRSNIPARHRATHLTYLAAIHHRGGPPAGLVQARRRSSHQKQKPARPSARTRKIAVSVSWSGQ